MAIDPLTLFSSSSVLPFGLLLLLVREGENEFARLAILRPGPQVARDSYDLFRVRTSHGTALQLPTIPRISNQALSRIQSAPTLLCGVQETIPRGPPFHEGGVDGILQSSIGHLIELFFEVGTAISRRWSAQLVPKAIASSTATHQALRCHTREAEEFCFHCIASFFIFRYPYLVGHDPKTEPVRCYPAAALLFLLFPQKSFLEFDLHRVCMDPKTSC